MKKISLAGVILGMIVGALAAMLSGTWIFWLGVGLAIGMLLGAAQVRKSRSSEAALRQTPETRLGHGVNS